MRAVLWSRLAAGRYAFLARGEATLRAPSCRLLASLAAPRWVPSRSSPRVQRHEEPSFHTPPPPPVVGRIFQSGIPHVVPAVPSTPAVNVRNRLIRKTQTGW